ncbi:Solute carrier family 35 member F3 [Chelonia mydas]|uniref:Solute carrier family 35 member F3 n=1 Tax=Chelonia mydas TaxID=8469 RepID=M7AW52_CHEMY|nr:Solute carrier family 35 member F3 [Chelonia mydas]
MPIPEHEASCQEGDVPTVTDAAEDPVYDQKTQQQYEDVDLTQQKQFMSTTGDEHSQESPAPPEAQMQAGVEGSGRGNRCCWKCSVTQLKKFFWGVAVVLGVCSSWSGSTQLAKLTFTKFDAPFTLTWFATNWNFLFFPLYYIGHVFKSAEKQSPKQRYSIVKEGSEFTIEGLQAEYV